MSERISKRKLPMDRIKQRAPRSSDGPTSNGLALLRRQDGLVRSCSPSAQLIKCQLRSSKAPPHGPRRGPSVHWYPAPLPLPTTNDLKFDTKEPPDMRALETKNGRYE